MKSIGSNVDLASGALLLFFAACSSPPDIETGEARRDRVIAEKEAAATGGSKRGSSSTSSASSAGACIDKVASPGSGQHHAGEDCLSCHASLSNAKFTVAGTLFFDGKAATGATIEIVDCTGKKLALPTADNGNFYTTDAVGFPLTVRASKCPANADMDTKAATGSCNAKSCHGGGVDLK